MKRSLVFIHGVGLGEWIFQEYFVPYYRAQGFDVHTFNLPGHSIHSTGVERQRVSLDSCVRFVEEYLDANLTSPFVLVGMSMGGAICQKLLEKGYSNKHLCGMVLLCSVPPENNLVFTLRLCNKLALSSPQILVDFFSKKTNPQLIFSPETLSGIPRMEIENYLHKVLNGFSLLEYEIFFKNVIAKHFTVNIPLKIIGGKDDLLFAPDVVEFTASYYSQRAEILSGLGHMIPIEPNYMQCIHAINSFLKEVL